MFTWTHESGLDGNPKFIISCIPEPISLIWKGIQKICKAKISEIGQKMMKKELKMDERMRNF